MVAVTLLYELLGTVESPIGGDSGWARQNGATPKLGTKTTWDLCFGSTGRAQRPELLPVSIPT